MPVFLTRDTDQKLKVLVGLGFIIVLALKLHFASVLDLYSDEIFYWLASTHPALAYSDLPFMTALLAGLGNALSPGNNLAVRALFLVMGSTIPLLVFWIARPLNGSRQALESAALSLCLPLGGFLGLLAVPDVPLIFFGLIALGSFDRALRTNAWLWWLSTGLFVALGLSTHYRFILYPAAAVLFLLGFRREYRQWHNPRFWVATGIAALGLVPVLWFNLSHQLSSASFYFVDRHPWEFQAGGLLHLFKQAGLVTPPLYLLLFYSAWWLWQKARGGHREAALFLSVGLLNLLVYLVLAPWTDANSTSIHWPLSGYFPLLIFLPGALRDLGERLRSRYSNKALACSLLVVIGIGYAGTLTALLGVGSQAYQEPLQAILGNNVLSNKMAGWREFAAHTRTVLDDQFPGSQPVIVTDNYYTAAQVGFAGLDNRLYTIDTDKSVSDGRLTQLQLWRMDLQGLRESRASNALFITEDSTLEVEQKHALLETICQNSAATSYLGDLTLFGGDKRFSYYLSENIGSTQGDTSHPCPYPMRAWIDAPLADAALTGEVQITGWAFSEDVGVDSVEVLIDDVVVGRASYGGNRQDVVNVMGVDNEPNAPNFGFSMTLDTRSLANGRHKLALAIHNRAGATLRYGQRRVHIEN